MPSARLRAVCLPLLALGLTAVTSAQTPSPAPPEARQFDFWLGDWEVISPDGQRQGANRIERVADGCGLLETWTGDPVAGNGTGRSLNAWNAEKRQWQQFWLGSDGDVLELAGGLDEQGRMVLSGAHEAKGRRVVERITWVPNADGSVRQLWEQSLDGGVTWTVAFDGRYRKKNAKVTGGSAGGRHALYYLFW